MYFFIMFVCDCPICDPTPGSQKTLGANLLPRTGGFRSAGQFSVQAEASPGLAYLCHLGHTRLKPDALQLSCLEYHDRGWARAPCLLAITVAGMRLDHGAALRSGRGIASSARSFAPDWIRSPSV